MILADRAATPADYLARYALIDLALDTYPYASHTTASDALWAGCPLVSYCGQAMASRVSSSVLAAAGLTEMIARDESQYQQIIRELAADRPRLRALRDRIQRDVRRSPLYDTPSFVRCLEGGFVAMHEGRRRWTSRRGSAGDSSCSRHPGPAAGACPGQLVGLSMTGSA